MGICTSSEWKIRYIWYLPVTVDLYVICRMKKKFLSAISLDIKILGLHEALFPKLVDIPKRFSRFDYFFLFCRTNFTFSEVNLRQPYFKLIYILSKRNAHLLLNIHPIYCDNTIIIMTSSVKLFGWMCDVQCDWSMFIFVIIYIWTMNEFFFYFILILYWAFKENVRFKFNIFK